MLRPIPTTTYKTKNNTMNNTNNTNKTNYTAQKFYYIYILTNDANDKVYIGQTVDPKDRFYACQYRGEKIKAAIAEIGWDKFHANLLAKTRTEARANKLERHFIEKYDSVNNGYNSTYKTNEHRSAKKSAERNAKARVTMMMTRWYFNPATGETTRIVKGSLVPNGFILGRGGKIKKVKGHSLWQKVEVPVAEIA